MFSRTHFSPLGNCSLVGKSTHETSCATPAIQPVRGSAMTAPPPSYLPFLKSRHSWSGLAVVLIIGFLSYSYESVRDQFPWLVTAQLWTYGKMAHAQARASRAKWVVAVEVDNLSFFRPPLYRTGPEDITNREFLAQVVRHAAKANAAVIALDINLVREETNAESTAAADARLWDAIQVTSAVHIPVVLTFALDTKAMRLLNNVLDQSQAPAWLWSNTLFKRRMALVSRAKVSTTGMCTAEVT